MAIGIFKLFHWNHQEITWLGIPWENFYKNFNLFYFTYIRDSGKESIVSFNVVFVASFSAGISLYFSNDVSPHCYMTQEQQACNTNLKIFFGSEECSTLSRDLVHIHPITIELRETCLYSLQTSLTHFSNHFRQITFTIHYMLNIIFLKNNFVAKLCISSQEF